ncbi:MAG TPA: hypothetical protein VK492_01520 [Chitinophagaceae bacterium]|nr:hypothetical protein [Chitinophagaceae bacterium]
MVNLELTRVEKEITKAIDETTNMLKIDAAVNEDYCPGILIPSQVLVTLMARIGRSLGVMIPDSCYIFHDKKNHQQLSIKEAAKKLIKEAKNGNE